MSENEMVYKIYHDIENVPKQTMYLKPLCVGIGTGLGTFAGYFIASDNNTFLNMCFGATIGFLGIGIYNVHKFRKLKKKSDLAKERLEVFQIEAKKLIGENANLDYVNVLGQLNIDSLSKSASFKYYDTLFMDGNYISENIHDGVYECVYCKQSENKAEDPVEINLNSAVDLAYKKVPNRKKKIRQNK